MTRIYTDGSRDSSTLTNLTWMLAGVAVGAALMYMLDPSQGNRRRALARDKALSAGRKASTLIGAKTHDLGNRARGWRAKASTLVDEVSTALNNQGGAYSTGDTQRRHGRDRQRRYTGDTQRQPS